MKKIASRPKDEGPELKTWFASAHRATKEELIRQIDFITKNAVVNGVLTSVSGLMAVLNEDRQVLAINDSFLTLLGIHNPSGALGLRPGEMLECAHSKDNAAGCGTSEFCSTCGAAIAIVASLSTNRPVERKCIMTAKKGGGFEDFCFAVKAVPLTLEESRFVLLFLQDITEHERRSELARAFSHDIKNIAMGLGCAIDMMSSKKAEGSTRLHKKIRRLSESLIREVKIQSSIVNNTYSDFPIKPVSGPVHQVVSDIRDIFSNHPASLGKTLTIVDTVPSITLVTDFPLLVRVLSNMLVNAFEASGQGEEVKLRIEQGKESVIFSVWNRAVIREDTAKRIFQRYFSTKHEPGRGLGTYSMKLFGEKFLKGKVNFTTSEKDGTIFSLSLPRKAATSITTRSAKRSGTRPSRDPA